MTAAGRLPAPPEGPPREDHFVHLSEASWQDYERLLEMRGGHSAPRIAYLDGVLEIKSPSIDHESVKSNIGCLLEVWMEEHGIEYRKLGSWTLKKKPENKGAEPDESYVLEGDFEHPERPDLVIEVIWTRGGLDKLAIYASLGIPEIWLWEQGRVGVHVLRGHGYVETPRSSRLPAIDLALLASFVDLTSTSSAKREYRAALRSTR